MHKKQFKNSNDIPAHISAEFKRQSFNDKVLDRLQKSLFFNIVSAFSMFLIFDSTNGLLLGFVSGLIFIIVTVLATLGALSYFIPDKVCAWVVWLKG